LNYIPAGKPFSSIDAFKHILMEDKKLQAVVVPKNCWQDIGTPASYRQAAMDRAISLAFEKAYSTVGSKPVDRKKLKGDGSQRQWYRLTSDRGSLIMVDHGIRESRTTTEVDAFVKVGAHLYRQGVSVPGIVFYDTFCGLVFLEDLGDDHLQQAVNSMDDPAAKIKLYQTVIDQIIRMSRLGAEKFDPAWTYQTPTYDRNLILDKECRYFQEAFLNDYLGHETVYDDLAPEYNLLAEKALRGPTLGFMHRDMQSRNIMLKCDTVYFIDFQGGRIGPIQYDLAALLIDPYVELPLGLQNRLVDYSIQKLSAQISLDPAEFRTCYRYCALARNLQILGAFAYLSKVAGKKQFEQYMPAAVRTLRTNLKTDDRNDFPQLSGVVEEVYQRFNSEFAANGR
jgi:aminoglycoside/choline kinase family phosphotransferase